MRTILILLIIAAGTVFSAPFSIDCRYQLEPTATYRAFAKSYAKQHYASDSFRLIRPEVIVMHATDSPTLEQTIAFFRNTMLTGRKEIEQGGSLNVGVHFIIDRDGTVYSFIPLNYMARHTIGFNHTAIGIENVAVNNESLTTPQLESSAELVTYLSTIIPSIKYLIGHHEYNDNMRAHYKLMQINDTAYTPYQKGDPGWTFMSALRTRVAQKGLMLLD
ncbi:MAG: N-acetylmuramoyl-L-alanine amidase [Spirochaetes bacterium]|nr:N-acetylmuramoyl-L-alanine amidase [Spirochaetota bacterium]